MESAIKIRGSVGAVSTAFNECKNPNYFIKHYDFKGGAQLCDALIRRKELDKKLCGVYTLERLESVFAEARAKK